MLIVPLPLGPAVGMRRAPGTKSERKRLASRFWSTRMVLASYSAAMIASADLTSSGFATIVAVDVAFGIDCAATRDEANGINIVRTIHGPHLIVHFLRVNQRCAR